MYYKSQNYSNMKIFIICAFVLHRNTHAELKLSMLSCYELTVCVVVNGKNFHALTLTLIRQYPMSNSSEIFAYTTIYSNFKINYFSSYHSYTHKHTHTQKHTHTDEYSIHVVVIDKPQLL